MNKILEIKDFLKWQVRRWTWDDYAWMFAAFCIGAGFADRGTIFYLGVGIILLMMIFTLVNWQWSSWKRERAELLKTIKEGK